MNLQYIAVVLIDEQEATLKRFRKKGDTIALEAANDNFETRIYSGNQVRELFEKGLSVKPIVYGLRESCLHFENIGK